MSQLATISFQSRSCVALLSQLIVASLLIASPGMAEEPLRIGVILPLSGKLAEYGEAIQNGLAFAQEERKIAVAEIVEDGAYSPQQSLSAFRKLAPNVDAIYGWGTDPCEALAPVAEQMQKELICVSVRPEISANRRFVMTFSYTANDIGAVLSDYVRSKPVLKKGIVKGSLRFVDQVHEELNRSFGSPIETVMQYESGEMDFRSGLTKLSREHYDLIGVFLPSGQLSTFYRQMGEQRLSVQTMALSFLDSSQEIRAAGPAVEGAVFVAPSVSDAFRKRYLAKFSKDAQIGWAVNGYEFGKLLATASRPSVIQSLLKHPYVDGEGGRIVRNGAPGLQGFVSPLELRVVQNGTSVIWRAGLSSDSPVKK